ncbi:hypothetical protein M0812_25835 [Anaeramoeba flamelloides]|uniref:B box-type domain-containing protein n=1 Tax=Anaeramoeba flamelloides TaxID=1746091 RepID=A0AAV7YEH6_9EUKA|nr:hypothetical protein M0812_25835 [Anaeramoeba flamelloides]
MEKKVCSNCHTLKICPYLCNICKKGFCGGCIQFLEQHSKECQLEWEKTKKYTRHPCAKCVLDRERDSEEPKRYCRHCKAILCNTHAFEICNLHIAQVEKIEEVSKRYEAKSNKLLEKTRTLIQKRKENVRLLENLRTQTREQEELELNQIWKLKNDCIEFITQEMKTNEQCINSTQNQKIQQIMSKMLFCDHNLKQLNLFQELANEIISCNQKKEYAKSIINSKSLEKSTGLLMIDPPRADEEPKFTVTLNVGQMKTEINKLGFSSVFNLPKTTFEIQETFGGGFENIKKKTASAYFI